MFWGGFSWKEPNRSNLCPMEHNFVMPMKDNIIFITRILYNEPNE